MDFCVVGRVKLFGPPHLGHLFKLIEWFVDVFLLKLDVFFCFGMPVWSLFQGILVGGILAIKVLFFFSLSHEKGLRKLRVLLFKDVSVVGQQTQDIVWKVELWVCLFNLFFNDFLFRNWYLFFKTLHLLGLLLGNHLFDLRSAGLDKFSEEGFQIFIVFVFHQYGESF